MLLIAIACTVESQDTAIDCDLTDDFPEVTPDPANADYPDPEVDVYCTDDELVVLSNGIPGFAYVQATPNDLEAIDWEWRVTRSPQLTGTTSDIPELGLAGFTVSGLPIYGPNEGPPTYGDPVYDAILDDCLGHTAPEGDYHFHALVTACILGTTDQVQPVLGYAMDGFPIYGPTGCLDEACTESATMESAWEQVGDPSEGAWDAYQVGEATGDTVLDSCNGREQPDGSYGYHVTATFPYILGCYRGTAEGAGDDQGGGAP